MRPEPQNSPTSSPQRGGVHLIPVPIGDEFLSPPSCIRGWPGCVLRAPMPKAAIDEYSEPLLREEDVHLAPNLR
jgi:hypothetical protein